MLLLTDRNLTPLDRGNLHFCPLTVRRLECARAYEVFIFATIRSVIAVL